MDPRFLELKDVLALHEESLRRFGGSPGLRDAGAVEAAMGAALNAYHYAQADLFEIAAHYAFHLAEAQAFLTATNAPAWELR